MRRVLRRQNDADASSLNRLLVTFSHVNLQQIIIVYITTLKQK